MTRKYGQSPGYGKIITDPETGERYVTDLETGEFVKLEHQEVPEGSVFLTPQELRRREEYRKMKEKEAEREFYRKHGPRFYFALSSTRYKDLLPATMARLVYLATFLDYDGKLKNEQKVVIKKDDLQEIMLFSSQSQVSYFWREANPKYLYEDEAGNLVMSETYFQRGKLQPGDTFQKFYIEAVRELYRKTDPRRHKYLGAVFQMLPFVNMEYNAICHNPDAKEINDIDFLTLDEFCDYINYDKSNKHRLPKMYKEITFPVGDSQEVFCAFVTDGGDIGSAKIFVNPWVLYKGDSLDKVQLLGKFCEQKS